VNQTLARTKTSDFPSQGNTFKKNTQIGLLAQLQVT
jgi:hypothetical protein